MNIKKYAVELTGTFTLAFVVLLSLSGSFVISTPVLAGLCLALFVYSIGHISGTHINPAVTIGAWSIGKIKMADAIYYIIAQFIGAALAMFVAIKLFSVGVPVISVYNTSIVFFAELIGTFFFTFGIASVVYGNVPSQVSGLVVGGSLVLGIAMSAVLGSNGVLNPAVALGIGSMNLSYVLGPVVGAVLGMQFYRFVDKK
jgi:aquaporin Z